MPGSRTQPSLIGVWVAAALLLAACAGPWKNSPQQLSGPQWTLRSPEGWVQLSTPDSEMLSRDGPYLAYILIHSRPLDHRLRFTQQKLDPGVLPHEAARIIADNLRCDPLIRQFRLLAGEPATVDGHDGFKLVYSFLDSYDVTIKTVYYGVVLSDRFFNLRFTATERHYFEAEYPTFNQVFESLRLAGGRRDQDVARSVSAAGQRIRSSSLGQESR